MKLDYYPRLSLLLRHQLAVFPEHRSYLQRRFAGCDEHHLGLADDVADKVLRIAGDAAHRMCEDYRWLTAVVVEEELHFRRNGRYRLSRFADAVTEVYSDREFMSRYMNGLLLSQVWWRNHTEVIGFYRDRFVNSRHSHLAHLEVGPGHGLLLCYSLASPHCARAVGWDVSDASIATTRAALAAMGVASQVDLRVANLFERPNGQFGSITLSEVLEHVEDPLGALRILRDLLAPGGRIFVNAPVNSPAPDHIYLFKSPAEVVAMVEASGFDLEQTLFSPCSGASMERARRLGLSMSAAVIATKAL